MPTYNFATITAAQALALTAADILQVDVGAANTTTIQFIAGANTPLDRISMTVGNTSVVFSSTLSSATTAFADGSRLFVGTSGNDSPSAFGGEANGLYGGAGADTLLGGGGTNQVQGNQGDDMLVGGSGYDVIYGGQDNDTILVGASAAGGGTNFAQGNRGADTISGSPVDNDTILGGQDNDVLGASDRGNATPISRYFIYENPIGSSVGGNDFINGNLGDDVIYGGTGNDTLSGEDGNDQIFDTGGHSLLSGGAGVDFIRVSGGQSTINAGEGDDFVRLFQGTFVIDLGGGNDLCNVPAFNADVRVTINAGDGGDQIGGGRGSDSIDGGAGDDFLAGGSGADTLVGGAGADEFDFYPDAAALLVDDIDVILDWNSEDRVFFQNATTESITGAGTAQNYVEISAADFEAARAAADARVGTGVIQYVVVQVGPDMFIFADSSNDDGTADSAVRIVGRSLSDISMEDFGG